MAHTPSIRLPSCPRDNGGPGWWGVPPGQYRHTTRAATGAGWTSRMAAGWDGKQGSDHSRHREGRKPGMIRRILVVAFALATVGGVMSPAVASSALTHTRSAPAHASTTVTFALLNYHSDLCLGISKGLAGQWPCTYKNDQAWHQGPRTPSGFGELENDNGGCLAPANGSTAAGVRLVSTNCTQEIYKWWAFTGNTCGNGYQTILNDASFEVIGVKANRKAKGASVVQWPSQYPTCNNQLWRPVTISGSLPAAARGPAHRQPSPGLRDPAERIPRGTQCASTVGLCKG
jgi:hypothetical protein